MKYHRCALLIGLVLFTLALAFPSVADPNKPTSLADLLSGSDGSNRGRSSD